MSNKIIKQGVVAVDTFNNDNDGVIIALTCNKEEFAKSGTFAELMDMILLNSMHSLPQNINQVLGTEIEDYRDIFQPCIFIEDAIKKVSEENNEDVVLDYYHLERITVGRDGMKMLGKKHPDGRTAALAVFGGKGMSKGSIYGQELHNQVLLVLDQILLTDPLTTRYYHIPFGVMTYIREYYRKLFEEKGTVSYFDNITSTTKERPVTEYYPMEIALDQKMSEFRKEFVLEDQLLWVRDKDKKQINVAQYLADLGVWLWGEFIRYSIK